MEKKTASIVGATGLIGSHLLEILTGDPSFDRVRIVSRRPLAFNDPKIEVFVVDFSDRETLKRAIQGSDSVFCAVGTTNQKVKGDKEAYRKVDYFIPVTLADLCAESGTPRFLLVSSIGANGKSSNFYLKLKGEVEDTVRNLPIPSISVFRPSFLLGKRSEVRPGENIAQHLSKIFSFLIPSNYKPINAKIVANAMVKASKMDQKGFKVYFYKDMVNL